MQDTAGCCTFTELSVTLPNLSSTSEPGYQAGGWKLCPLTSPTDASPLQNYALSTGNALLQGNLTKWRRSAYSFHLLLQTTISSNRCRPQFVPICQPATLVSISPQVRLPLRCPCRHEQSTECIFSHKQRDPMVPVNAPLSGHYPSSASETVRWLSCLPTT